MQTANILLALAGDSGNTVSKFGVTPSEVAVLRLLHGDDAVTEIDPGPVVERTMRAERTRLVEKYGRQHEGRFVSPAVDALFPGAAARVFEKFEELELPEELYKAESRKAPANAVPASSGEGVQDGLQGGVNGAPEAGQDGLRSEQPAEGDIGVEDKFEDMTKAELVDYAKAQDIEIDPSNKKADILAEVRRVEAERSVPPAGGEGDGIGDMGDENLFK